jgi:Icc-related predicted phosphoesterase
MKLCWLTDPHLEFTDYLDVENLCKKIRSTNAEALLITGDIGTSSSLCRHLEFLARHLDKTIYFVLGNHDYYGSSIKIVNRDVAKLVKWTKNLVWLSKAGIIELSSDTCLIGHEGLADARLGNPEGSGVILNDYIRIQDLVQPTKELRIEVQRKLGDSAARYLRKQLKVAVSKYSKIIVALHVPPFPEACWHEGKNTDDNYLPHFGCEATGRVLKSVMLMHPEISMTVFCGHTHSGGFAQILPNLKVYTAGAEYRYPAIADVIEI